MMSIGLKDLCLMFMVMIGNFNIFNFQFLLSNSFHFKIEPPTFIDNTNSESINFNSSLTKNDYETFVFVKTVNEYEDFTLKCLARGKPKPKVTWYLKYLNGTFIRKNF